MELLAKSLPGPRRRGRGRGADLPRRDHGVPRLRGRRARRARWTTTGMRVDVLGRPAGGRAAARRSSTRSPTTRTRPGCPCRLQRRQALVDLARRYGFLILEDVAYRELGFDGQRAARACGRWRPDVVLQAGTFSKIFFPGFPARLGGRAGRGHRAARSWPSRTPTSARARSASGCSRSTGAAATSTASSSPSRALYARRAELTVAGAGRGTCPRAPPGPRRAAASSSGSPLPDGVDTVALSAAASARKVAYVPGRAVLPRRRRGHADPAGLQPGRRRPHRRGHPPHRRGA